MYTTFKGHTHPLINIKLPAVLASSLLRALLLDAAAHARAADDEDDSRHDDDRDDEEREQQFAGGNLRERRFDGCTKNSFDANCLHLSHSSLNS